jgi:hypothetical protein
MAREKLSIPWERIDRPASPQMTAEELATGHPTAPGYRERSTPRAGMAGPGVDGQPGVPRTRPGRRGQKGFPGQVGPPVQPGNDYDGPHDF